MKKILCAVLVLCMLLCCACKKTTGSFGYEQDGKPTLRVGMECDYAPFNWTQTDDSHDAIPIQGQSGYYAAGYDVAIARRVAAALGMEAVAVKLDWDGLLPALEAGTVDVIIANMSPTEERRKTVDFSEFYYENDIVVVTKKDGAYAAAAQLSDFSGATLLAQKGTTNVDMLVQIPDVKQSTPLEDISQMRASLMSGVIDGYVSERCEAVGFTRANPDYVFVAFEDGKGFSYDPNTVNAAIAVKRGYTEYVEKINTSLAAISDQEREALMVQAIDDQPSAQ